MPQQLDTRQIIPGFRGELWADDGTRLVQVPQFQAQIVFRNTDYHPAGSPVEVAILTAVSATLTFTETVIEDATLLKKLFDSIKAGEQPVFGFQGKLTRPDGEEEWVVFRSVVPDGNIDLINVRPGDIVSREWSWRVNELPDLQTYLGR